MSETDNNRIDDIITIAISVIKVSPNVTQFIFEEPLNIKAGDVLEHIETKYDSETGRGVQTYRFIHNVNAASKEFESKTNANP